MWTHSPTKSLLGPTAIEFQFHETCEGQFVKPSQCLLVNTTYLLLETQVHHVMNTSNIIKMAFTNLPNVEIVDQYIYEKCRSTKNANKQHWSLLFRNQCRKSLWAGAV